MLSSRALRHLFLLAAVGALPACDDFSCSRKKAAPEPAASRAASSAEPEAALERETLSPNLIVDQFGYRPALGKVAIISDPLLGWNAGKGYTPGETLEVRRFSDGEVVFSGKPAVEFPYAGRYAPQESEP